MQSLQEKIIREGVVQEGGVLLVDHFLNHRLDIEFLNEVGLAFHEIFRKKSVDKILTIESSGIAIATITAQYLHVPVVFAKKGTHINLPEEVYIEEVEGYTQRTKTPLVVAKSMLCKGERILILDDFLAKGHALKALISMVRKAEAEVVGVGIVIEKTFQGGGDALRQEGCPLFSLAKILSMEPPAEPGGPPCIVFSTDAPDLAREA